MDASIFVEGQVVFLKTILTECNLKYFYNPMCISHLKLQNGRVSFGFVLFAKPELCAIQRLFLEVNVLHNPKLIHELL